MTRETILIILGLVIVLSPWSGLPLAWLSYVLVFIGLCVVLIGSTLRARRMVESAAAEATKLHTVPLATPARSPSATPTSTPQAETTTNLETAPLQQIDPLPPSRRSRIAKF